jgi:ArsR family transcriptional regulator
MNTTSAIEPSQIKPKADIVSGQLRLLSNPNRLRIVCSLMDGEMSVSALEAKLSLSQPSLSRELARLRTANILTPRREAKSVFYSLTSPEMIHLIEAICLACPAMENAK